ncbi:juvenile hormone esterase-like [Planococcus citri]|uniref:juvenile hormone esterase-like n=1 Tax=Planococcus citri TaxID=170843 RepID=UPI0031F76EAA
MFREIIGLPLFLFIALVHHDDALDISVTIQQGTLRGGIHLSRNNSEYYGFLGIPFAKPPVGDLRFEPPQPPEAWNGVRDATLPPPICIQKEIFTYDDHLREIVGQEDCLYLNLFVPKAKKMHPLPVMVYMHGGGFVVGGADFYEATYFMDHDVIIIVIQYRLNILGFLSTGDDVVPGNNGMKDQVMALKWIQKNIADFGGNPNQVTIFGESAGAGSVHYHMHSPLSKGLFHRAISQSGSSLASWAMQSRKLARQRAHALGIITYCPITSSQNLVNCLRKIPAREIVIAHNKFYAWDAEPTVPFSVVAEPSTVKEAFIYQSPWHQDTVNNVPWMVGMTSAEGIVKAARYLHENGTKAKYLNAHYKRLLPIAFYYGSYIEDREKVDQITESIKKFYFGDKNIGMETAKELIQLYSDGYFTYSVLEAARRYKGPVYFYYYDHRNKRTFTEIFGQIAGDLGVCHVDDLISLFPLNGFVPKITEGDDLKVSERLVKYWVNFAASGNPNGDDALWAPVPVSKDFEYLHITTNQDQVKTGLLLDSYEFWKSLNVIPPPEDVKVSSTKYVNEF